MENVKLIPGRYYWCKTSTREDAKWMLGKASSDGLALGMIPVELLPALHPHPIPTPDEIGCARCGLHKHGCEDSLCQWKFEPPSSQRVSDVISNFEGMRLLRKDEIKRGKKVYILGSDGRGHLLTIVSDDFYRDEDTELAETQAHYYQEKGELYVTER